MLDIHLADFLKLESVFRRLVSRHRWDCLTERRNEPLNMLKWSYTTGMLIIFISSFMIVVPFSQWEIGLPRVPKLDSHGIGYWHYSYHSSRLAIALLFLGNVLVVISYAMNKLLNRIDR